MFGILDVGTEDQIAEVEIALTVVESFLKRFDPLLHQSEASLLRSRIALVALRDSLGAERTPALLPNE